MQYARFGSILPVGCDSLRGCAPTRSTPWLKPEACARISVTDDPDRSWAQLAPHVLHEANAYAAWAAGVPGASPFRAAKDVSQLKESGLYAVVTPEECLALAATLDPLAALTVKPLVAGLDPDLGWASLELFVDRVAPALA